MDHSMHANHKTASEEPMMDHSMKMYFHFGYGDTVLFKPFVINSQIHLLVACFLFLLMAILYEALKYYRQFVLKKNCKFYQLTTISNQLNENSPTEVEGRDVSTDWKKSNVYFLHLYQSFLHVLQVTMSYTLMFGFMTFNIWICLSILFGAGLGYFLFFKQKLNYEFINEHCH